MTDKSDKKNIRELSADELLAIAGGRIMIEQSKRPWDVDIRTCRPYKPFILT
jgi:hypothetical protein